MMKFPGGKTNTSRIHSITLRNYIYIYNIKYKRPDISMGSDIFYCRLVFFQNMSDDNMRH